MSKTKVSFKHAVERQQAIDFIENILDGLKKNTIYVENAGESVTLVPEDQITFAVEAKQKGEKEKLSFKLSWKRTPVLEKEESTLKILAEEPEMEKEPEHSEEESSGDSQAGPEGKDTSAEGASAPDEEKPKAKKQEEPRKAGATGSVTASAGAPNDSAASDKAGATSSGSKSRPPAKKKAKKK